MSKSYLALKRHLLKAGYQCGPRQSPALIAPSGDVWFCSYEHHKDLAAEVCLFLGDYYHATDGWAVVGYAWVHGSESWYAVIEGENVPPTAGQCSALRAMIAAGDNPLFIRHFTRVAAMWERWNADGKQG